MQSKMSETIDDLDYLLLTAIAERVALVMDDAARALTRY